MTDNNATHSLFAELLEGAKALEERPTLIADRDKAKAESDFHKARLDEYKIWHDDMSKQIADLKATIEAKEADLVQATFRESQVRSQLEMLVGAFKTVVGEAQAAVELVEPPKPATPDVPSNVTEAQPTEAQPAATPFEGSEAVADTSPSQDTSDTSQGSNTIAANTSDSEVSGNIPAGAPTPNATAPRPYWAKPTAMKWSEWISKGGERAPWVGAYQLENAY